MTLDGPIFALDLAIRTGFAIGPCGGIPHSGHVVLKNVGEDRAVALANLIAWLDTHFRAARPALVVKEAPLPLQAYRDRGNSEARILMDYGMHGIVEAMCRRFGLPPAKQWHSATVRKHFIGQGRMGTREATKEAVLQRCHVLGYMPKNVTDFDRADALAIWDFAAATEGRRPLKELVMFGERRA